MVYNVQCAKNAYVQKYTLPHHFVCCFINKYVGLTSVPESIVFVCMIAISMRGASDLCVGASMRGINIGQFAT